MTDPGISLFYPRICFKNSFCPRRLFHLVSGRSSDFRIILLTAPSHFQFRTASCKLKNQSETVSNSGILRLSSPITAAGPSPNLTEFSY